MDLDVIVFKQALLDQLKLVEAEEQRLLECVDREEEKEIIFEVRIVCTVLLVVMCSPLIHSHFIQGGGEPLLLLVLMGSKSTSYGERKKPWPKSRAGLERTSETQ
jgi:hypothetical protein